MVLKEGCIVSHNLNGVLAKKQIINDPMFLLANKKGGFLFLDARENKSRYQGYYLNRNWELYKTIENIRLLGAEPTEIRNNFFNIERISGNSVERFITDHTDTLLYEVKNFSGFIELVLDCRQIYDYSTAGRIYNITNEQGCLVIEYVKFKDDSLAEEVYKIYVVIRGVKEYNQVSKWEHRFYQQDYERNSTPCELDVYNALQLKVDNRIVCAFSSSLDKNEAIEAVKYAIDNFGFLKKSKENYVKTLTKVELNTVNKEIIAAYKSSIFSMDNLLVNAQGNPGIYAGFQWFTQLWTRDEAICLKSLMIDERYDEVKQILFRHLGQILTDGRVPNRFPYSQLGSADGVGWVFKRMSDYIEILSNEGRLNEFLSQSDIQEILQKLSRSITGLLKHHTKDGLAYSGHLETWMDTNYKDDTREGYRIEIQALRLCMYELMMELCNLTGNSPKHRKYAELLDVTLDQVRQVFWKTPLLYDGSEDPTIRPNIFMAYYIYPKLLKKREWITCFDHALGQLWLSWGGIATIERNHRYFIDHYTGENNQSYHRGDSWFFINNMVAISLYKLDRHRYRNYINKIITASTKEILYSGIIGFHAEVSSAATLKSEASLAQAWSSALYIELINEIF